MNIFAPVAWYDRLAAKLFVPLAIRLCHLFRITQYQLHDYLWMLFYWTFEAYSLSHYKTMSWIWLFIVTTVCMSWTMRVAGQRYTTPELASSKPSWSVFQRRALLVCESYHSGVHILYAIGILGGPAWAHGASFDMSCPMLWYALVADYAITIRHLPPREEKEPELESAHQNT